MATHSPPTTQGLDTSAVLWIPHHQFIAVGWAALVFFLGLSGWLSFQTMNLIGFVILSPFVLLGLSILIFVGKTGISDSAMWHRSRYKTDSIRWDEIQEVLTDSSEYQIVFVGAQKQLVVPGIQFWSGPAAEPAFTRLKQALETHNIPERVDPMAAFRITRNCRIREQRQE